MFSSFRLGDLPGYTSDQTSPANKLAGFGPKGAKATRGRGDHTPSPRPQQAGTQPDGATQGRGDHATRHPAKRRTPRRQRLRAASKNFGGLL